MISTVVLTKNEEKNIKNCLQSVKWCDEIIIVDDCSDDQTVKIAKKMGAKVFSRRLKGDFAAQRNFALRQAQGEWVLFVDADERVPDQLAAEIKQAIENEKVNGFFLKRQDFFRGKRLQHGETASIRLLRLGRKGVGRWQRRVHETWEVRGELGELKEALFHYPHPTLTEFLEEVNFYSSLNAQEFLRKGKRAGLIQIIAYPPGKFLQNYIFRLGFLDGTPGAIVALMMSFHSFLTRAKLYLLWKKGDWWELRK
jgi:glycosyltransferase involved in cell wall biosynthesis